LHPLQEQTILCGSHCGRLPPVRHGPKAVRQTPTGI